MKRLLFGIAIIIFALYFFDFGFLKGEITEYSLLCNKEDYVDYRCIGKWLPLNPTTYKPNVKKQQVLYWVISYIETLNKCGVVNRRNWSCKYNDESGTFGFIEGRFWSSSSSLDELFEIRYVSKFVYRLEEMKW